MIFGTSDHGAATCRVKLHYLMKWVERAFRKMDADFLYDFYRNNFIDYSQ